MRDAAKIIKKCIDKKIYGIFYAGGKVLTFEEMIKKLTLNSKKKEFIKSTNEPVKHQIIKNDKIIELTPF